MSESDPVNRGLEGITVAETKLSDIDGEAGELIISGFPIDELATNATYEECVFLLFHDRLPTAAELEAFRTDLAGRRGICEEVRAVLRRAAAEDVPAMDALRMGAAAATLEADGTDDTDLTPDADGTDDTDLTPDADGTDDTDLTAGVDEMIAVGPGDADAQLGTSVATASARRIVAVFPTIVATYWRYRQGAEPIAPDPALGHVANYLSMLTGEDPTDAQVRGLETYLNTVVDHGINASTFTARTVVSTESDLVSAATAAVGSLKGPLHGGAPGPVLEMLRTVHDSGDPEGYVRETLASEERLMGFGHRVYRVRDPRAAVLSPAAERVYDAANADEDFFETAREFESIAVDALTEHKPGRRLETNVEFYTAVLLDGVGISPALFTPTFAVSRVGGWMAHCLEQRADNRLVRPVSRYVGERDRAWTPVADR